MSAADPENPPLDETLSSGRGFDGAWVMSGSTRCACPPDA